MLMIVNTTVTCLRLSGGFCLAGLHMVGDMRRSVVQGAENVYHDVTNSFDDIAATNRQTSRQQALTNHNWNWLSYTHITPSLKSVLGSFQITTSNVQLEVFSKVVLYNV